jgi:hypothetical protein
MKIKHGGIIVGYLLILINFIIVGIFWNKLPSPIPWLYSLPWGEEQLVSKYWFVGGTGIVSFVFFVDIILGMWLGKKDKILTDLAIWFGVGIILIYLASFWRVLMIVI